MKIKPFQLEEYLTKHEFTAKYLLCCSDAQSVRVSDLTSMATPEEKELWDHLTLQYTEPFGHPLLRKKIADLMYPNLKPENILCFAGAEEGIFAVLSVLCQQNDHAIILSPCYQSLSDIPRSQGAKVTEVLLTEEDQWRINIKAIEAALLPETKCIIINFPHNPTGQVIDEEELQELVALCKKRDIWLFSDEVYRLLGKPEKSWSQPAACAYDKAISLNVMSKSFGLPGLRIGWIACQNTDMIHQIKQVKDYLSICNSAPSEILSIIALSNMDTILDRNNRIVESNLKLLDQFFIDYKHLFEWVRPQGGCVGFVKYKGAESIDSFCDRLVKEKNVLLMPASIYNHKSNYFRIGFGRENMPEALEQFKAFLDNEQ